jgi:predicted  nucleic acid-binding Zn-ribbon protein
MATDYAQIITALAGAVSGGVGLKIIDAFLLRGKNKDDAAGKFREEQRQEIQRLKTELVNTERELDELKVRYYALNQELSNIMFQLRFVLDQMEYGAVIDLKKAFSRFLEMASSNINTVKNGGNDGKHTSEDSPDKNA